MPKLARRRVHDFFDQFGTALSRGDVDAIARCFSYPSLVVTDTASRVISTPHDVVDAFARSDEPESTRGLARVRASIESLERPSIAVAWVTVRWSYRDELDRERHADAYRYLVRALESSIEICTVTPVPTDWGAQNRVIIGGWKPSADSIVSSI